MSYSTTEVNAVCFLNAPLFPKNNILATAPYRKAIRQEIAGPFDERLG